MLYVNSISIKLENKTNILLPMSLLTPLLPQAAHFLPSSQVTFPLPDCSGVTAITKMRPLGLTFS